MKRPAAYMLLFLIFGILTAYIAYSGLSLVIFPVFALVIFLTYALLKKTGDDHSAGLPYIYLFPFFFTAGFILTAARLRPVSDYLDDHIASSPAVVRGIVEDTEKRYGGLIITVCVDETDIGLMTVKATYKITTDAVYGKDIETGAAITLSGTLKKPARKLFDGDKNNFLYLRSRKIEYTMKVDGIWIKEGSPSPKSALYRLRDSLSEVFDKALPDTEAGLIKAMITGDSSGLDTELTELYRVAGIYHILVVSGAHLSILCLAVRGFLMLLRLDKAKSGLVALLFLFFYCVMTGAGASSVRALIMSFALILGDLLHRRTETLTSLSVAGIILLLYEPLYIFDAGFLYSFSAVFGIGYLSLPIKNIFTLLSERSKTTRIFFSQEYIANYLPAVCGAYFATIPVCAFFFGEVSTYGILGNIVISGSSALVVILGFLTGIAGLVFFPAAVFFSGSLYVLLSFYEFICRAVAALPASRIIVGRDIALVLVYIALWAVVSYVFSAKRLRKLNLMVK